MGGIIEWQWRREFYVDSVRITVYPWIHAEHTKRVPTVMTCSESKNGKREN